MYRNIYQGNLRLDSIGEIINQLYYSPLSNEIKLSDRGANIDSCEDILSSTEFKKYYSNHEYIDLKNGVRNALYKDGTYERIAIAFRNELIYQLITKHNVSYEAAYNFTEGLIVPDGIYAPIDKESTYYNLITKLLDPRRMRHAYGIIDNINSIIEATCNEEGIKYKSLF